VARLTEDLTQIDTVAAATATRPQRPDATYRAPPRA